MAPLRSVCILETSFIVSEGLKHIISKLTDFNILDHFETCSAIEKYIALPECNMLICNPDLIKNVQSITKLRIKNPNLKILVVDQEKNEYKDFLNPSLIDGYIFLCCHTSEVLKSILAVSRGEKFFCDKALGYMLSARNKMEVCNPLNLSEREAEILKLIVKGFSSKEISDELSVSFHTITTHRKNICKKLKVSKVSGLIATAHKLNIA